MEQDRVLTLEMPYESPEEIEIDEMDAYNSTEDSDLGKTYSVPIRFNLEIIDNSGCIDGHYTPVSTGKGVDVYIVDTGINYDHEDFG